MKLVPCLLVGSLLFGSGNTALGQPPVREVSTTKKPVCEQSFAQVERLEGSINATPDLKIFPPPEAKNPPLEIPQTPYLITTQQIPGIIGKLVKAINYLQQDPSDISTSRQAHRMIRQLHVWLRGPIEQLDIPTYALHFVEPTIAHEYQQEKHSLKKWRFLHVLPTMPKLLGLLNDLEIDIGLRAQIQLIKNAFAKLVVESQLLTYSQLFFNSSPGDKWAAVLNLEAELKRDEWDIPSGQAATLLKLAVLYSDADVLKRLMSKYEMNGFGARLNMMDKRIAEVILLGDESALDFLPGLLADNMELRLSRLWSVRWGRQTAYFRSQLARFRRSYEAPLPLTETTRSINHFLGQFDADAWDFAAYKQAYLIKEHIVKEAIHWQSRDPLEKSEAGRALWLAIRLITVL